VNEGEYGGCILYENRIMKLEIVLRSGRRQEMRENYGGGKSN
jgi:hypothetical protein